MLLVDWELVKSNLDSNITILNLLKRADMQVRHYIGIFLDLKRNSTEEEQLFEFMQHHRVWDFEYTNRQESYPLVLIQNYYIQWDFSFAAARYS